MKPTKTLWLCLAAVCMLVAAVAPSAMAKSKVLELRTREGLIPPGGELVLAAGAFSFESPNGKTECEAALLSGTLGSNNSTKDLGSISAVGFQREQPEKGGRCATEGSAYPASPIATASGLPWSITFKNNYTFEIGAKPIRFELSGEEGSCVYETKKLKGSYSFTGSGQFEPDLVGQKLKLAKHQSAGCAKEVLAGIPAPYVAFVALSNREIIEGAVH